MSDPLGLSIGTTNLVAARVGNQPVTRRSVLTLFGHAAPEVGVPSAHTDGIVLSGFVERVGDPVPLVAAGRVVASRRPATGRCPAGDGLLHRRPAVAADRDRRSGALGNIDAVGAAHRDAGQPEPCAQRNAGPAGIRRRRLADGAARQSRAEPARRGGAAGLRWRRDEHHVGGRRIGVRADRRHHPILGVLRRSDRPGAAEPRPRRHRQRRWRSTRRVPRRSGRSPGCARSAATPRNGCRRRR